MKLFRILFLLLLSNYTFSQNNFTYSGLIHFPVADSLISPYLCTVDAAGNLWVGSTNTLEATAKHSVFMAAPGDTIFKLIIDASVTDSVRNITGITSIGNDIFISARMIAPADDAAPDYYPYSQIFYLPEGDFSKIKILKKPVYWDYGTWYTSIASTKDGFIYFGQSYLVTLGTIDGRKSSAGFGNTIDFARVDWGTPMEPGGGLTYPNIMDLIRDVAVIPNANYNDTSTVIFTSRNSSSDPGGESTGGIAMWTGGKQSSPLAYHSTRLKDLSGFLTFTSSAPYGISINPSNNNLFVCGTDDTKKWVKGFQITGDFAIQNEELPSSTSMDVKDPVGAPFIAPSDVAFNNEGSTAYVTDAGMKKVFKFSKLTAVFDKEDIVKGFSVDQNYPNPFNPVTSITVNILTSVKVKAEVFDALGRRVRTLTDKEFSAGVHILSFDGMGLSSGIYLCKVTAGDFSRTIKMLLSK